MTNPPRDFDDAQVLFKAALSDAYKLLSSSGDPLWLEADTATRKHLARMVAENKMIALGYVPSSWTHTGTCRKCGTVPLEEPTQGELVGCPWCAAGSAPHVYTFV
jgi:hypothetical protein